ncbi:hypothetical protein Dip518_000798 [Parelusimicrobium proximum]|uniref:hypothetical protein n=1 Tax=Parelusimicrobium proximum TaxID=3228953 RepID=UPI003D1795C5
MRRTCCIIIVCLSVMLCACAGPSLRHKKDINTLLAKGHSEAAANKFEASKDKYAERNAIMFYSNLGSLQYDAMQPDKANQSFAQAQILLEDRLKSISKGTASVLINDNTTSYLPPDFEQTLLYFYRSGAFLDMKDLGGALVEARKAVYFLDRRRESVKSKYKDDPFVQYWASILFESEGNRSSARIARQNALNAYSSAPYAVDTPGFAVPKDADKYGEIIFLHFNGIAPSKISRTTQFLWGDVLLAVHDTDELYNESPQVQNAVLSGIAGNSVTVSYPVLIDNPYSIVSSGIIINGSEHPTISVSNISALAHIDLEEKSAAQMARMITRAVIKKSTEIAARKTVESATNDENWGALAGLALNIFNAATESADTRQWFTLPAEIRMSRVFVPPGVYTITFAGKDYMGQNIETKEFENIEIKQAERIFLHHRTAK